jgi:hypothetical protein
MALVVCTLKGKIGRYIAHAKASTPSAHPERFERQHHKRRPWHVPHGSRKPIGGLQHYHKQRTTRYNGVQCSADAGDCQKLFQSRFGSCANVFSSLLCALSRSYFRMYPFCAMTFARQRCPSCDTAWTPDEVTHRL